jgi:AcrR family transcriptional regulator
MNRRDLQKHETLTDILRSAEELFLNQGFEKTTMRGIADHAGLTKGALYHHFDSKEKLFARICDDHNTALLDSVLPIVEDKKASVFERLRRVLELHQGTGISGFSFVSHYLLRRGDEGSAFLRERLTRSERNFYVTVVAPLLKEGRERGEWGFASSPEVLALLFQRLGLGIGEEINMVFAEMASRSNAENRIKEILGAYIYVISRIFNIDLEAASRLIGLEGSLRFYHTLLKKSA